MISLIGIATHPSKRAEMVTHESVTVASTGLLPDRSHMKLSRQVTVLCAENWADACRAVGREGLTWLTRRANLLVAGIRLGPQHVGMRLHIGDVVLEVTGETDPCPRMDEQVAGLTAALTPEWRGGVNCRVRMTGDIAKGMEVTID